MPRAISDAKAALALFVVYNVECERYDRSACTGLLDAGGAVQAANKTERGKIADHAGRLGAVLLERAERLGVPKAELVIADRLIQSAHIGRLERSYAQACEVIGGSLAGGAFRSAAAKERAKP